MGQGSRLWGVVVCTALLWALGNGAQADLVLGVHPFKPPSKLIEAFTPLANHLSDVMGQKVTVHVARDYQTHIDTVGRDEVEIAYMGPVLYVKMRDRYGEKPLLARQQIGASPVFHGVIIVRQESPIRSLTALRGKHFAFGEPHSTMSHLVPRFMLSQAGITVEQFASHKFVGDHVNVALGVLGGDYDAGAVKEDVYLQYQSRGLRALGTSAAYSDHLFVTSRRLPADQTAKLRVALLELHRLPSGLPILQAMTRGVTALVPVQDGDYDNLRQVLKKLRDLGMES